MINLSCSAMAIPGISLDTISAANGPSIQPEMAHSSRQQEIDLLFYVSKSFVERQLFAAWKNTAVDDLTQAVGYYDDYVGEINLYPMKRGQYGFDDNVLIGCRLVQAYPKFIGSIQYAYEADNQIAVLPVTMCFKYHELF
jgi:hypothetical protein